MKHIIGITALLASIVALSGCTTGMGVYSHSMDNILILRAATGATPLGVEAFTAENPGQNSLMIRLVGPVETPNREPFEAFIHKAMTDELKLANLYDATAERRLRGHLLETSVSTVGSGSWTIKMRFEGDGIEPFTVEHSRAFRSAYVAQQAQQNAAQAFMPTVQEFVGKVFSHPQFQALASASPPRST